MEDKLDRDLDKSLEDDRPLWRELIGMIAAVLILFSFVAIGFIQFFAHGARTDDLVNFDAGWLSAMLSLASTAFGYLVGKHIPGRRPLPPARGERCPTCGR